MRAPVRPSLPVLEAACARRCVRACACACMCHLACACVRVPACVRASAFVGVGLRACGRARTRMRVCVRVCVCVSIRIWRRAAGWAGGSGLGRRRRRPSRVGAGGCPPRVCRRDRCAAPGADRGPLGNTRPTGAEAKRERTKRSKQTSERGRPVVSGQCDSVRRRAADPVPMLSAPQASTLARHPCTPARPGPMQMWTGAEPSPGADKAGVTQVPAQMRPGLTQRIRPGVFRPSRSRMPE